MMHWIMWSDILITVLGDPIIYTISSNRIYLLVIVILQKIAHLSRHMNPFTCCRGKDSIIYKGSLQQSICAYLIDKNIQGTYIKEDYGKLGISTIDTKLRVEDGYLYVYSCKDIKSTYLQVIGDRKYIDKLEKICTAYYKEHITAKELLRKKEVIYFNLGDGSRYVICNKTFDNILLDDKVKHRLTEDIDEFLNSKQRYHKLGIPYKRTYLLYGPPGTGKSSISRAIANYTRRDIYTNIHHLISGNILLLEDFDRKQITDIREELYILDGYERLDDTIVIITMNDITKLEEAVLREGRVDVKFNIVPPTPKTIEDIFTKQYGPESISAIKSITPNSYTIMNILLNCSTYKELLAYIEKH